MYQKKKEEKGLACIVDKENKKKSKESVITVTKIISTEITKGQTEKQI